MIQVGVLGATGAVGQRFVQLLSNHPYFDLTTLTASKRNVGKTYAEAVNWRLDSPFPTSLADQRVVDTDISALKDVELVFSALPAELAGTIEMACAKAGIGVCSNASTHRMFDHVPLVVPEINGDHLGLVDLQRDEDGYDGFIVTNPNCSTIMLTLSLHALQQYHIRDVKVSTMQAISGAGFEGVPGMAILDNIIPYIGSEEEKMEQETGKIMGTFDGSTVTKASFPVSASCHRVPLIDGHTMAVWAECDASVEMAKKAFISYKAPFSGLPTQPKKSVLYHNEPDRPQPRLDRMKGGGMTVSVGRVREGLRYIAMGHNTIRGAAGGSVLNAELLKEKGYL
jgi:aspartate-semialdehyde dehydrogenase